MAFKSIIDPAPAGQARISYAVRMASRYGAHLIGIFMVPFVSGGSHSVAESFVEGRQAVQQIIAAYQAREAAVINDAKRDFSAYCTREDISFEFRFLHQGDFHDGVALNCMHTDLAIVGSPRSAGLPNDWSARIAPSRYWRAISPVAGVSDRFHCRACRCRLEREPRGAARGSGRASASHQRAVRHHPRGRSPKESPLRRGAWLRHGPISSSSRSQGERRAGAVAWRAGCQDHPGVCGTPRCRSHCCRSL
jgi:hypothetical protein